MRDAAVVRGGPEFRRPVGAARRNRAGAARPVAAASRGPVQAAREGRTPAHHGRGRSRRRGAIRSREDAIRALDAVAEFFRRNEPSSPIPLFIDRAKRLVSKDFLEVLADVAPDAVAQARAAGGFRQSE